MGISCSASVSKSGGRTMFRRHGLGLRPIESISRAPEVCTCDIIRPIQTFYGRGLSAIVLITQSLCVSQGTEVLHHVIPICVVTPRSIGVVLVDGFEDRLLQSHTKKFAFKPGNDCDVIGEKNYLDVGGIGSQAVMISFLWMRRSLENIFCGIRSSPASNGPVSDSLGS